MDNSKRLLIYTDGASRNNPGPSAAAFIILKDNTIVCKKAYFIGENTNNTAEYQAIIDALKEASNITDGEVLVYSDSELVIKQINGQYKIKKDHLNQLCNRVKALQPEFKAVTFLHTSRNNKYIQIADGLCNECLDQQANKQEAT